MWRVYVGAVVRMCWGMGGVPNGVGFARRWTSVYWAGVSGVDVMSDAGGCMVGLLMSMHLKLEVRRRILT